MTATDLAAVRGMGYIRRMLAIKASIFEFISSDTYPNLVRCRFTDAWGRERIFLEKEPVVSAAADDLDATTILPQPAEIGCELIRRWRDGAGREIVTVDTEKPWCVWDENEQTRFDLLPDQLTEI